MPVKPKVSVNTPETQPIAYSPREFAALFNKEQSWGYRQIYKGNVSTITKYGRILIPASELEKILATADRYQGKEPRPKTKGEMEKMKPELQSAWGAFIQRKTEGKGTGRKKESKAGQPKTTASKERQAALKRLRKS